jgi:hypothetical protein
LFPFDYVLRYDIIVFVVFKPAFRRSSFKNNNGGYLVFTGDYWLLLSF